MSQPCTAGRGHYRFDGRGALLGSLLSFLSAGALAIAVAVAYTELGAAGWIDPQLAALLVTPLLVIVAVLVAAAGVRAVPVRSPRAGIATVLLAALAAAVLGWLLRLWSWTGDWSGVGPHALPSAPADLAARAGRL
ncbi:MAG TPA: hypothetical protein VL172_22300, partial [Kofleriaceae bacterium]|nr:hypothetical protein [Kofleriaceae bacterium]